MTKQQWADIKDRVGKMYERVFLLCDGYLVSPAVQREKMKLIYDARIYTMPYFASPAAFVAHIRKHCQSIAVITYEEYKERLAALEASNATE